MFEEPTSLTAAPQVAAFEANEAMRYRHVVFADAMRRVVCGAPIDFASSGKSDAVEVQSSARIELSATSLSPEQTSFFRWLLRHAGLNAAAYRPESLARRMYACLRTLRVASVVQARQRLHDDPALIPAAVASVLIGVTSLFRDANVFEDLERSVLPDLVRRCETLRIPLRVRSIGCSEGAELYSLAIVLDELGWLERTMLVGSDCRADAIAHARVGAFDLAALRNVSPVRLARYFHESPSPRRRVVAPHVRYRIAWRVADALGHDESLDDRAAWHIILCRNMAMYMKPEFAARLWERIAEALAPGGVLVLGKAERPIGAMKRFVQIAPCVYRREN